MGKRSDFPRHKNDAYDTPIDAVKPLVPHLPARVTYIEPCAGKHQLVDALSELLPDSRCLAAKDIAPRDPRVHKGNALTIRARRAAPEAQMFITNPPFLWSVCREIILNLYWQRPTWLLLPADLMHTDQFAPLLPFCRKVVTIGRVRWRLDTNSSGKDNYAWYLFVAPPDRPIFLGRPL